MIGLRWLVLLSGVLMLVLLLWLLPVRLDVGVAIVWVALLVAVINAITSDLLDQNLLQPPQSTLKEAQRWLNAVLFGQALADVAAIGFLIHLTGGAGSPARLLLLIYLATLATMFPRWLLVGVVIAALGAYSLLVFAYLERWLQPVLLNPSFARWQLLVPREARWADMAFFNLSGLLITVLVEGVSTEAYRLWFRSVRQQRFLEQLHRTTRLSLEYERMDPLHAELAEQMQAMLECESLWLLRWRGEGKRVEPVAVAGRTFGRVWLPPAETLWSLDAPTQLKDEDPNSPLPGVVLALPLFEHGRQQHPLGVALAVYLDNHRFTIEELNLAAQLADTVGLLISRSELNIETRIRSLLLERLARQVARSERVLNMDAVCREAVKGIRYLLDADRAALYLYYANRDVVECPYAEGLSSKYVRMICNYYRSVPDSALLESVSLMQVVDVQTDARVTTFRPLMEQEGFRSYTAFSARTDQQVQGVLVVYWDRPYRLTSDEEAVGRLYADHVGMLLQNAHLYELLSHQSLTDALTSLPNRRALDRQITYESQRSQRSGHPFVLLMLDLDGFKVINDTFGHPVGDQVLQQVAMALRYVLRSTDFIARYGGDEFAVLLPETGLESALKVARKLRWAVRHCALPSPATGFPLGVSQGVAAYPQHAQDATALLRLADQALYHVKQKHKGGVAVVSERGDFELRLQP